jgi:type II secretion system protein C
MRSATVADLALMGQLFGSRETTAAPDSGLSLVLSGTFVWDGPNSGIAIVGAVAEQPSVYHVGSELPGGLILSEVFQDRIVVRRGSESQTIHFPEWSPGSTVDSGSLAAQAAEQPNSVLGGLARAVPIMQGKNMTGYVVYPTDDTNAFSEMGLRAGDLLVAINGTRLDDSKVAPGLVATLAWASGVAVTVKRGGRERDLVLDPTRANQSAEQRRQIFALASTAQDPVVQPYRRRAAPVRSSGAEP